MFEGSILNDEGHKSSNEGPNKKMDTNEFKRSTPLWEDEHFSAQIYYLTRVIIRAHCDENDDRCILIIVNKPIDEYR